MTDRRTRTRQEMRLERRLAGLYFASIAGLLLLSLYMDKRMKRETLGGGDIKLLFLTGLFFGWKGNLLCLTLACVAGIVWGLAGKRRGEAIPWGPSIAVGAWITALAGQMFIDWYLGFFA